MDKTNHFIVFMLDDKEFALPLQPVDRVVRAVEVTVLPKAPVIVSGLINYRGTVLPVINLRPRFHLPEREIQTNDQLIIVQTNARTIALQVDTVTGNIEKPATDVVPPSEIIEDMEFLAGVLKLESGILLIPDLDKILTAKEDKALAKALESKIKTKSKGKEPGK